MVFDTKIYCCPFCKQTIGKASRGGIAIVEESVESMDSDGYDWSGMSSDDYIMCQGCRNVFDIRTGNNGGSTLYESKLIREEEPVSIPVKAGLLQKLRSLMGLEKPPEFDMSDARFQVLTGLGLRIREIKRREREKEEEDEFEIY